MRGTSLKKTQIDHARSFINARDRNGFLPQDEQVVSIPFGQMVRLVAWYGAMRFEAASKGVGGTLEEPGEMVVKK